MTDGAHLGIDAARSARAVIGGDEPEGVERTPAEMRVYLLAAPEPPYDLSDGITDRHYADASRWAGKQVLAAFAAHPFLVNLPVETDYDWNGDPDHGAQGMKAEFVLRPSVTHEMERLGFSLRGHGLSGFQVGWGVNAARYVVGADYGGNPAILEVDG